MKTLKAAFADVMVIIGEKVIPVIVKVVSWFEKHSGVTKLLAAAVGGVLVVAIGAYTVSMISAAVATIAATWPILLIIVAVAALAAGIVWVATKNHMVPDHLAVHDVIARQGVAVDVERHPCSNHPLRPQRLRVHR